MHPRGHFWFNREIPDIVAVPVVSGKQKEINFKIIIHNYMQSKSFNCIMDEDYSLSQCFMDYIRQVKEYEQGEFLCFFLLFMAACVNVGRLLLTLIERGSWMLLESRGG